MAKNLMLDKKILTNQMKKTILNIKNLEDLLDFKILHLSLHNMTLVVHTPLLVNMTDPLITLLHQEKAIHPTNQEILSRKNTMALSIVKLGVLLEAYYSTQLLLSH
jgi:hypothetical protein